MKEQEENSSLVAENEDGSHGDVREHRAEENDEATDVQDEESPEESPENGSGENPGPPEPDIAQLISDAEQRGYLRAKQEFARRLFDAPSAVTEITTAVQPRSTPAGFLSREHRSIWDM